jgi:hypothetical protein
MTLIEQGALLHHAYRTEPNTLPRLQICSREVAKSSKSREPILLSKIESSKNPKKFRGNFKKLKYGCGP